jgi:hypothetical protein
VDQHGVAFVRAVPLGQIKTGINRLREKGGASAESLYDAVNCYVTASRSVEMRPGSVHAHALPAGLTKGLMLYKDKFLVFASQAVDPSDPEIAVEVLKHPDPESAATLVDIHFAAPFLGYPYVVAEWSDGVVKHYWLQTAETWQSNHVYREGQVVAPTVPNGYGYRATRLGGAAATWAPNVARSIGDKVEPTESSGYEHTVIDVQGASPRSGDTEPDWAETDGGITYEDADNEAAQSGSGSGGSTSVPPEVEDRYSGGFRTNTAERV